MLLLIGGLLWAQDGGTGSKIAPLEVKPVAGLSEAVDHVFAGESETTSSGRNLSTKSHYEAPQELTSAGDGWKLLM